MLKGYENLIRNNPHDGHGFALILFWGKKWWYFLLYSRNRYVKKCYVKIASAEIGMVEIAMVMIATATITRP